MWLYVGEFFSFLDAFYYVNIIIIDFIVDEHLECFQVLTHVYCCHGIFFVCVMTHVHIFLLGTYVEIMLVMIYTYVHANFFFFLQLTCELF